MILIKDSKENTDKNNDFIRKKPFSVKRKNIHYDFIRRIFKSSEETNENSIPYFFESIEKYLATKLKSKLLLILVYNNHFIILKKILFAINLISSFENFLF